MAIAIKTIPVLTGDVAARFIEIVESSRNAATTVISEGAQDASVVWWNAQKMQRLNFLINNIWKTQKDKTLDFKLYTIRWGGLWIKAQPVLLAYITLIYE